MQIIDMFFYFLCLTKNMRGSFAEKIFKHPSFIILPNDMLGGFVYEGCISIKVGVGNGLGKCSGNDYVSLTGFFMEELSHRRY